VQRVVLHPELVDPVLKALRPVQAAAGEAAGPGVGHARELSAPGFAVGGGEPLTELGAHEQREPADGAENQQAEAEPQAVERVNSNKKVAHDELRSGLIGSRGRQLTGTNVLEQTSTVRIQAS
jgi:hypothetical protein